MSVENDIKTSIELNIEYSFDFFTSKAKEPVSCVWKYPEIEVKGTGKQILSVLLCLSSPACG